MAAACRSFVDAFAGTKELKEVFTIIGWIAVNHAALEQHLDYLLWQLEVFDYASRRRHKGNTDAQIRELSKQLRQSGKQKSTRVEDRLEGIRKHLTSGGVASKLEEIGQRKRVVGDWAYLSAAISELGNRRNAVVHSAVSWCGGSATGLIRESTWSRDFPHLELDLDRDKKLVSEIGDASTRLGLFSTELAQALPFKGDHVIMTGVARI